MAQSLENKRAGREEELRKKLKAAIERYETVFATPLSTQTLLEFLEYSAQQERMKFLVDRVGVLSLMDVKYLKNVLKEHPVSSTESPQVEDEDVDEIDEIDEDDLEKLNAP